METAERHFAQDELSRYRHLVELRTDATIGVQLLATAFNVSDAALLEPLRERFEAAARGIERRLSQLGTGSLRQQLAPLFGRLVELGTGSDGGFGLRAREIALERRQGDILVRNHDLAIELVVEAEGLVNVARARAEEAMREKLAALGELTAGVAHEIKNPLNFVKNFSEVSEELLQELLEEISRDAGAGDAEPDEESRELITEIGEDLTGNLKRIREHGDRVNQIVQSMLMMGSGNRPTSTPCFRSTPGSPITTRG